MAYEIERKFLLSSRAWRAVITRSRPIQLGYLFNTEDIAVRISVTPEGGLLCVKRPTNDALIRHELQEVIDRDEALGLLAKYCPKTITKTRHYVGPWEIDEFHGDNEGLFVAEIELDGPEDLVVLPDWIGKEVTYDPYFLNTSLMNYPYCEWTF